MDPIKTGIIIFEARKKLKMTQKELADKLFISDKAVSKWERGLCFPDISVLIPLTEILEISLYDLLKGENMNKNDVEETLKNTINYTNDEIKKKNKKYIIISSIVISIVIMISIVSMVFIKKNSDTGAIVDRDTIYDISHYINYKTSIDSNESEKIEEIFMKLPLDWKERTFETNKNSIEIQYSVSYKDIVKVYNDENYVNLAIVDIASVLFTTISDVDNIKVRFNDYSYSITRKILQEEYSISSFDELGNKEKWDNVVSRELENKNSVNDTFKLFKKNKVSKSELEKNLISDR